MPRADTRIAMPPATVVLFLSLLLGLQPLTTDLYLPALPGMARELGASMPQAQLTLTALLLAFGTSQLIWGPLSDRFGRRPVLLAGVAAYMVASIGCALSPSIGALLVWRTLQGAAMGAAVMCARAIVRDLYQPEEGASVMSKGLSGLAVIACLSAPLGGAVTAWFGWHATLMVLAVFGAVTLGLIVWRFEETVQHKNHRALEVGTLVRTWSTILQNPTFLAFSALSVFSYCGLFTFLATSSFVFIQALDYSATQYGLVMLFSASVYLMGTFWCRRLLLTMGVRKVVAIAGVLTLTGGTTMGILALAGFQPAWSILLPHSLFMLAHGIHQPCSQSGAVGPFPKAAGAASALNGFLMMVAAFFTGQWIGTHMDGGILALTNGMWFWSVLIALCAWTMVQRHGNS